MIAAEIVIGVLGVHSGNIKTSDVIDLQHMQCSLAQLCFPISRPQRRDFTEDRRSSTYNVFENIQDVVLTDATLPPIRSTAIDNR